MSFDAHECFAFDSFFQQLLFFDDYEGDGLKDLWNVTVTNVGTAVVVDAQTGGEVRLTTDANDNDSVQIDWGDIRSLLASKNVTIEGRIAVSSTASIRIEFGLFNDATHLIVFEFDTDDADTNWQITTDDGTGPTTADSGVAVSATTFILRIEATSTSIAFYIDDVEVTNSPLTTDIPTEYLQPYVFLQTRTTAAKTLDVDYIYARQER